MTSTSVSGGARPRRTTKAALLLATAPLDNVTGQVTYGHEIFKEFGGITEAKGTGVDRKGSGCSQI